MNIYTILPNIINYYFIKLIYFTGYEERIGEQLLRLIEYIMDKADYNDKAAVCLIYGIYKICREENCTFDRILEYLGNSAVLEADLAVYGTQSAAAGAGNDLIRHLQRPEPLRSQAVR